MRNRIPAARPLRIALIGYGKMGRAVESVAAQRGHVICATVQRGGPAITRENLADPDVAVEFTLPEAAVPNAAACMRAGIPVVVGTTGWTSHLSDLQDAVESLRGAALWAPNFSIGVQLLAQLIERLGGLAAERHGFSVQLIETHHAAKKDAPSGTAAMLARVYADAQSSAEPPAITSIRIGHVPGRHEVILDGAHEQIRLIHDTRDRRIFAEGAVTAAEWLARSPRRGLFTLRDVLLDEHGTTK